ncbi:FAD:protein FMN transferase [Gryllotalpicola sp.]|uniref:FAD:protein FMN transferase n=1 Tax=Gryllotalpicola sp. TaxID=1932787 RepID=UPI0026257766|nr:FAD:protein FMN transferase [Gryllotalpicola sp.]
MNDVRTVMGIPVSLDARPVVSPELVDDAFGVLERADAVFSPFRRDSEISRLDRGELSEGSADLLEVLQLAARFEADSGGAFSVRAAGRLDADGIVKGWAVQRAAELLESGGQRDFCLNAGGDIAVRGGPEPGRAWHAAIRSPWHPRAIAGVVALRDEAIATSGAYERGAHLHDGRTGEIANAFASVSVIHPSLTVADVCATAIMALGPDGPAWAHDSYGCSVVTISHAGVLDAIGDVRWARAA